MKSETFWNIDIKFVIIPWLWSYIINKKYPIFLHNSHLFEYIACQQCSLNISVPLTKTCRNCYDFVLLIKIWTLLEVIEASPACSTLIHFLLAPSLIKFSYFSLMKYLSSLVVADCSAKRRLGSHQTYCIINWITAAAVKTSKAKRRLAIFSGGFNPLFPRRQDKSASYVKMINCLINQRRWLLAHFSLRFLPHSSAPACRPPAPPTLLLSTRLPFEM